MRKDMEQIIEGIGINILFLETLEPRNSDSLDFHELSVWSIKEALETAYRAGMAAASDQGKTVRAEQKPTKQLMDPHERTRAAVYATGNKWAIENFNAVNGRND